MYFAPHCGWVVRHRLIDANRPLPAWPLGRSPLGRSPLGRLAAWPLGRASLSECARMGKSATFTNPDQTSTFAFEVTYRFSAKAEHNRSV